ncbi:PIR Superfamily Protein [Plasmodium ovale curtisi]|uniref:PIR Superfamily Protein n=1 Tax=Plasmodium ovale curtisi TaxID=864141 RepID=A0A1A8W0S2_PLAOA|nr:PIR Superfamily Protein [Plasmodium ovale curtisi]
MEDCDLGLESLNTFIQYAIFNTHVDVSAKNDFCKELNEKLPPNYENFNNFCYKLTRNLYKISDSLNKNPENNEECTNLIYWIYYEIVKNKYYGKADDISLSEVIQNFSDLWENYDYYGKCKFEYYKINATDFNILKQLYDYSRNYSTIHERSNKVSENCKKYYCNYINNIVQAYISAESGCSESMDKKYCTLFTEIKNSKKPGILFEHFKCVQGELKEGLVDEEKILRARTQASSLHRYDYSLGNIALGNSSSRVVIKVFFSILGILLICFFLIYKFTPARGWINDIIQKKKRTWGIMNEKVPEPGLEQTSEYEEEKEKNEKLKISYHSLLNY